MDFNRILAENTYFINGVTLEKCKPNIHERFCICRLEGQLRKLVLGGSAQIWHSHGHRALFRYHLRHRHHHRNVAQK